MGVHSFRDPVVWLPPGLVSEILSKLSPPDLAAASMVSRAWRAAAEVDCLWESFFDGMGTDAKGWHFDSSWKELYVRLFKTNLIKEPGTWAEMKVVELDGIPEQFLDAEPSLLLSLSFRALKRCGEFRVTVQFYDSGRNELNHLRTPWLTGSRSGWTHKTFHYLFIGEGLRTAGIEFCTKSGNTFENVELQEMKLSFLHPLETDQIFLKKDSVPLLDELNDEEDSSDEEGEELDEDLDSEL